MLNFLVAMLTKKTLFGLGLFLLALGLCGFAPRAQFAVRSPQEGETLQGVVPVEVVSTSSRAPVYRVSFAYEGEEEPRWFPIMVAEARVVEGRIAEWDTTAITDGDYRLRVEADYGSGTEEIIIRRLLVRNYSYSQPTPGVVSTTASSGSAPQATPSINVPTVPRQPSNPAEIPPETFIKVVRAGVISAIAVILLLGVYLGIKSLINR